MKLYSTTQTFRLKHVPLVRIASLCVCWKHLVKCRERIPGCTFSLFGHVSTIDLIDPARSATIDGVTDPFVAHDVNDIGGVLE